MSVYVKPLRLEILMARPYKLNALHSLPFTRAPLTTTLFFPLEVLYCSLKVLNGLLPSVLLCSFARRRELVEGLGVHLHSHLRLFNFTIIT